MAFAFLAAAAYAASGAYVYIKKDSYVPKVADKLRPYRGKHIYMASFTNSSTNTRGYDYYSSDQSVTYEADSTLDSYLWYGFQKALRNSHAWVYQDHLPPAPDIPELRLTITSWTDSDYSCNVVLLKYGLIAFTKTESLTFEPASSDHPDILEARAYRQMDKIIETVLGDPEFKQAFFRPE